MISELCYIGVLVHIPVYTIFSPAHWCETELDYRHTTVKQGSALFACLSSLAKEDQSSF